MTQVVKIYILTGHEDVGHLHFILYIYRKKMHFLKTCTVSYESIEQCLTKFYQNIFVCNHENNEGDNL